MTLSYNLGAWHNLINAHVYRWFSSPRVSSQDDRQVHSRTVHLDEGHQVGIEPVHSEAKVVSWGREEVETTSAVQMLQTKQILEIDNSHGLL